VAGGVDQDSPPADVLQPLDPATPDVEGQDVGVSRV
jgi:hypothetical protein